jgi:hypothetical protein
MVAIAEVAISDAAMMMLPLMMQPIDDLAMTMLPTSRTTHALNCPELLHFTYSALLVSVLCPAKVALACRAARQAGA